MEVNIGTYCGQLVIDGEILPVAEFNVEPESETVLIIIDKEGLFTQSFSPDKEVVVNN